MPLRLASFDTNTNHDTPPMAADQPRSVSSSVSEHATTICEAFSIARTVSASSSRSTPRTKRGACFKAVAATYAASLLRA